MRAIASSVGVGRGDEQIGGDRRGDAEREDQPEPEASPHHQLRDRDEVRRGHQHGADETDHDAERPDDERLSEEESEERHRRHETEAQPGLIHGERQQDERDG